MKPVPERPTRDEQPEEWRPVPWYRCYQVSDRGNFRRLPGGCRPAINLGSGFRDSRKFRCVRVIDVDGRQETRQLGALVLEAFGVFPPPPLGRWVVKYRDGDRGNCRLDNLEWVEV